MHFTGGQATGNSVSMKVSVQLYTLVVSIRGSNPRPIHLTEIILKKNIEKDSGVALSADLKFITHVSSAARKQSLFWLCQRGLSSVETQMFI